MKIKLKPQSTFQKMSLAFLLVGVLPLIIVCLMFMRRYENSASVTMASTMAEAEFFARNKVEQVIENIDRSMELLYDYSREPYNSLWEILESESINSNEKQMYIEVMLGQLLLADPSVSAAHFVEPDGTTFSSFYSQKKSLRTSPSPRHVLHRSPGDDMRQLFMLETANEGDWCTGSSDRVLTLARNYMDTRSLATVTTRSLGTVYVDLKTDALDEALASLNLGKRGNVAIIDNNSGKVVYCLYSDRELPAPGGDNADDEFEVFERAIGDHSYTLSVIFDLQELFSIHTSTKSYVIMTLLVALVLILTLALLFSGRISTPARKLKQAMEELRRGKLDTRVEIRSGDEMEYLGESFNQMAKDLSETIEQVYVAQICQRDAELNALKMQIQPHYLYNTLDIIRMSALEQKDAKTARLIESLSRQLRYIMGNHQDTVTLRQELDSLQEYGVLMTARYEGRIKLRIDVADSELKLFVPKLLLQPFVENAVRHGLRDKPGGGMVLIRAIRHPSHLELMVLNDGISIDPMRLEHIRDFLLSSKPGQQDEKGIVSVGMKNTLDRIKLNCGPEYGFTMDSDENLGVIVTVRLPIWEGKENVEGTSG